MKKGVICLAKRESLKTKLFQLVYNQLIDYSRLDNDGKIEIGKHAFFPLWEFIETNGLEQEYQEWKE